jgi:hypothetical protein
MTNQEKSRVLTLATLKRKGACVDQVALFRANFGTQVKVTAMLCEQHAGFFDWDWSSRNLLSTPFRAEYERATAPFRAEYERARAQAWAIAYINDQIGESQL